MVFNMDEMKMSLSSATSAVQASVNAKERAYNQQLISEINRQSAQRDKTLIAGAEAIIEQKNLLEQQLEFVQEQNNLLRDNYETLKEMYDAQVQANKEATAELKKSKRFNAVMMAISVISMFTAIASLIVTL